MLTEMSSHPNAQQAYMAQFYSLFESFMSLSQANFRPEWIPPPGFHGGGFECRLCGNVFTTAALLAQHSCPQITQTAFQCRECDKVSDDATTNLHAYCNILFANM